MATRLTKYAHVVQHLPKFVGETPDRQQLLNGLREEIRALHGDIILNSSAQIRSLIEDAQDDFEMAIAFAKQNITDTRASDFASAYADARAIKDAVADWASSAQLLVDAYEGLMIEQMESEGVASLRLASGASVSTYAEPYGQVVDKEKFRQWCVANGYEAQLQLWPSTMNAIAKERTLNGEAPPDGVEVFAKTMVRLNKA